MTAILCLSFLFLSPVAAFRFSNVFRSNMVLQRAPQKALLWGFTTAGDNVTITFGSFHQVVTAAADGKFTVELPATPAGGPYTITAESADANRTKTLENVLFGDVFFCGGQSNMKFTVSMAFNASAEIAAADNYPDIRIVTVGSPPSSCYQHKELESIAKYWNNATSEIVGKGNWTYFSAVCWFFGRDLYDKYHVPIGLISNNDGGSTIQQWSSPNALSKCNQTNGLYRNKSLEVEAIKPSCFWNSTIVPFLPMRLAGILWYQGEGNVGVGPQKGRDYYSCQFPAMIEDWRANFKNEELFFGFVQLHAYQDGGGTTLPELRTAQLTALELPMVTMVSAVDLGDLYSPFTSIHPRLKKPVGLRLSDAASALIYGENLVYQGPMIAGAEIIDNQVAIVYFKSSTLGSGLEIREAFCPEGLAPSYCMGFELQTSDMVWRPAKEKILLNQSVIVSLLNDSLPAAESIIGVRYGYADWPICTVYNKEGFPAIPFSYAIKS